MRITKKKITAVAASAAVVALGAGAAFAYWSGGGTATGSTTLGAFVPMTATINIDDSTPLFPGGSVPVTSADFTNQNDFAVSVVGFGTPAFSIVSSPGSCDAGWFSLTPAPPASGSFGTAAANGGTLNIPTPGFTVNMENSADNQDGCQGAEIEVTVSIVAVQA